MQLCDQGVISLGGGMDRLRPGFDVLDGGRLLTVLQPGDLGLGPTQPGSQVLAGEPGFLAQHSKPAAELGTPVRSGDQTPPGGMARAGSAAR